MVDYSKWKDIEISDDEDEVHPNIDTPSLFRWRHQARVERMEKEENSKKLLDFKKKDIDSKIKEITNKIQNEDGNIEVLQKDLSKLQMESKKLAAEEDDLLKKEKKTPWNVDTISKPGFEKTVINKVEEKSKKELTEEECEQKMIDFIKKYKPLMQKYGMLRKYGDSKRFLLEHNYLVTEDTASYLVLWCITLEVEEKHELMTHVAHQCICMQYILELASQLDVDPRACVGSFFDKIKNAAIEYRTQFETEIQAFIKRIEEKARIRIEEALKKQEEEDRLARLGPGGLDPADVFEELPDALKTCFESRDIKLLQDTIAKMPEEEAKYHMKRCVDSGLWVPEGGANAAALDETADQEIEEDDDEVYEDLHQTDDQENITIKKIISTDDID